MRINTHTIVLILGQGETGRMCSNFVNAALRFTLFKYLIPDALFV